MTEPVRCIGAPSENRTLPLAALTDSEQLLVWAMRSWAFAHQASRSVERDLVRACGREDGEKLALAVRSVLVMCALYGRRPLRVAPPGWPGVTMDELRLLQLFASAQREADCAARAHLTWLLQPDHASRPERAVAFAAETLAAHGLCLPWRGAAAPASDMAACEGVEGASRARGSSSWAAIDRLPAAARGVAELSAHRPAVRLCVDR